LAKYRKFFSFCALVRGDTLQIYGKALRFLKLVFQAADGEDLVILAAVVRHIANNGVCLCPRRLDLMMIMPWTRYRLSTIPHCILYRPYTFIYPRSAVCSTNKPHVQVHVLYQWKWAWWMKRSRHKHWTGADSDIGY